MRIHLFLLHKTHFRFRTAKLMAFTKTPLKEKKPRVLWTNDLLKTCLIAYYHFGGVFHNNLSTNLQSRFTALLIVTSSLNFLNSDIWTKSTRRTNGS